MEESETIQIANDRLPILQAFRSIGMEVGEWASTSSKLYCPFAEIYHLDGGREKSLRIYTDSNSAFCFAGCGYFSPVKLIAMTRDLSEVNAAEAILEDTGYVPPDFESQWDAMMNEKVVIDTSSLAEALKVACSRMCKDWENVQFDTRVSRMLSKCLGLLSKVKTEEDVTRWLETTKTVMWRTIGEGR